MHIDSIVFDDSFVQVTSALLNYNKVDDTRFRRAAVGNPLTFRTVKAALRKSNFAAELKSVTWAQLVELPLPVIGMSDLGSFVIYRIYGHKALIHRPAGKRPILVNLNELIGVSQLLVCILRRIGSENVAGVAGRRWLLTLLTPVRRLIPSCVVFAMLIQMLSFTIPISSQVLYDKIIPNKSIVSLDSLMVVLLFSCLVEAVLSIARGRLSSYVSGRIEYALALELYDRLMFAPLQFIQSSKSGALISYLRDIGTVRSFLGSTVPMVTADVSTAILGSLVLIVLAPWLGACTIIFIVIIVTLALALLPRIRAIGEQRAHAWSQCNATLAESISNSETIRTLGAESYFSKKWGKSVIELVNTSDASAVLISSSGTLISSISRFLNIAVLFIGARLIIDQSISIGSLVTFNLVSQRVLAPCLRMAQIINDYAEFRIAETRLGCLIEVAGRVQDPPLTLNFPRFRGNVTFADLAFSYQGNNRLAVQIPELEIQPGSIVGLIGGSGSGKSTIVRLIRGLYTPTQGAVLIDGIAVGEIGHLAMRSLVAVVNQENILFSGTLLENLTIGKPGARMDVVMAAAKLAGVTELAATLPDGFRTRIAERGTSLSGGQRQRIAIARAIISDPKVLILDEATSALDAESESIIRRNLRKMAEGRTVLVIAHRLITVRDADRIIVIEGGRIIEDGPPDTLASIAGRYAQFLALQ